MPELPEVETIRLGLQKYILGKIIENVEVRLRRIFSGDEKNVIGAEIKDVRRFGKGLVIDLDNGYSIAIHIKLTGQLIYEGSEVSKVSNVSRQKIGGELPNKWTHVVFKLKSTSQNSKLYYNDLRQFGWIKILKTSEVQNLPLFKELGPEPPVLSDYSSSDPANRRGSREALSGNSYRQGTYSKFTFQARTVLTLELFKQILYKSNVAIKPFLIDQKKISGIGNIYANDALFEARIDPRRKAKDLSESEIKKLYDAILKVLKDGLKYGGATEINFVNVLGQEGGYQNHFLVYGREGESCKVCKSSIKKIKLGGRGTYFCSKCQK